MSEIFTAKHQEALEQEVQILLMVLKRNKASHRRAKYYQRIQMAIKALRPCITLYQALQELQDIFRHEKKLKQKSEEYWSIEGNSSNVETSPQELFQKIHNDVTKELVDAIKRLEFAVEAIIPEMARGFFLPLHTVTLAAIARIRVLSLQLGTFVINELLSLSNTRESTTMLKQAQSYFTGMSTIESETNEGARDDVKEETPTANDIGERISLEEVAAHDGTTAEGDHDDEAGGNTQFIKVLQEKEQSRKRLVEPPKKKRDKKKKKRKKEKGDFFDQLFG